MWGFPWAVLSRTKVTNDRTDYRLQSDYHSIKCWWSYLRQCEDDLCSRVGGQLDNGQVYVLVVCREWEIMTGTAMTVIGLALCWSAPSAGVYSTWRASTTTRNWRVRTRLSVLSARWAALPWFHIDWTCGCVMQWHDTGWMSVLYSMHNYCVYIL